MSTRECRRRFLAVRFHIKNKVFSVSLYKATMQYMVYRCVSILISLMPVHLVASGRLWVEAEVFECIAIHVSQEILVNRRQTGSFHQVVRVKIARVGVRFLVIQYQF